MWIRLTVDVDMVIHAAMACTAAVEEVIEKHYAELPMKELD